MNKSKAILTVICLSLATSAQAALLINASADTYSYAFVGTNSNTAATVNISQYNSAGHFTFGVVEFDTSSLNLAGDKYLLMQASGFTDGSQGAPVTADGSYSISIGIMPLAFADYLASPSDSGPPPPGTGKTPWFNTNVLPLTPIGSLDFNNQGIAALNVTTAVNDWINGDDNFGFVLWNPTDAGSVQIHSIDGTGLLPQLNTSTVPEPSTYAVLAGVLALAATMVIRRKRN